jgi:hypothetical protein
MRKRIGFLCILTCALLADWLKGNATSSASKPKPPLKVPAITTFDNGPGLSIQSYNLGSYSDGVGGVQCVFFDPAAGGSGDLLFDTDYNSAPDTPPSRWLDFQFASPATVTCVPSSGGSVPASGLHPAHMVVGGGYWDPGVYDMPIHPTERRPFAAWFWVSGSTLRFSYPSGPSDDCSTPVWVTHPDADTWIIEATAAEVAPLYETVNRKTVPTSYWHMPFRITVTRK